MGSSVIIRYRHITLYLSMFLLIVACGRSVEPEAVVGGPAPGFEVKLIDGRTVRLEDFKGHPLVLTFMAEWCPCSNESAPVFKEAYQRYHPRGVEFLMLGFQDSQSKFRSFVEREKIPFPAGFDKGDRIGTRYGVNAPPTTFFITADGIIRRAFYGKIVEPEKLSQWIDEILPPQEVPQPEAEKEEIPLDKESNRI